MQRPEPSPASKGQYTVLKETRCECGQPIIALQAPNKTVTVMHKKPACHAWEKQRAMALDGRRGRGMTQPQSAPVTNRHARRRAEALARHGVKP